MKKNVVYGAGSFAKIFHNELEENQIKIDSFIDNFSDKKTLCNKPVILIKNIKDENINFYISIFDVKSADKIILDLKEKGFKNIFSFSQLLKNNPQMLRKSLETTKTWFCDQKNLMLNFSAFDELKELLVDQKSKNLLQQIIEFRETLAPKSYVKPDNKNQQYFENDLNLFSKLNEINFIDCGAYTGDTLEVAFSEFQKLNKKISYTGFEPEPKNYSFLHQTAQRYRQKYKTSKIEIFPYGVWKENKTLNFSDNGASSKVSIKQKPNLKKIEVVCLDNFLSFEPNFIKMDIEGSEKEALLGAKNIIQKFSPTLAICLYHKPQDLYELPLLINKINPNYNMHLRLYGELGLELVLYCIKK